MNNNDRRARPVSTNTKNYESSCMGAAFSVNLELEILAILDLLQLRVSYRAGWRKAPRSGGVRHVLAIAGMVLGVAGAGWADTPRRILLLYPESFYRPAVVTFDTAFRTHVRARYPGMVCFDMEKVGGRVCTDAAAHAAFETLLKIQYAQTPPDIGPTGRDKPLWRGTSGTAGCCSWRAAARSSMLETTIGDT